MIKSYHFLKKLCILLHIYQFIYSDSNILPHNTRKILDESSS